jgi:transketolase
MENKISNRQAICDTLIELAREDSDIIVLTSDSRGSAGLAPFVQAYPLQHIETGIAEQNIVGISAGLFTCGKKQLLHHQLVFCLCGA